MTKTRKTNKANGTKTTQRQEPHLVKPEAADNSLSLQVSTPPSEEIVQKYNEARELYDNDDYLRAAILLSEIIAEQPDHFGAIEMMGICSLHMQLFEKAEKFFKALTDHIPIYRKGYSFLGLTYFLQEKYKAAINIYEKGLALQDVAFDHLMLARAGGFIGETEKSKHHARQARELGKTHKEGLDKQILYFFVENFARIESKDDPLFEAIKRYDKSINKAKGPFVRAHHHTLMAKAYNDMKDYDKAFERYNKACGIVRSEVVHGDMDKLYALMDDMADFCDPEYLKAHEGKGHPSEQPVFVLGMPRSGTTLLEQVLHAHPEVMGIGEDMYLMQQLKYGFEIPPNGEKTFPFYSKPRLNETQMARDYETLGRFYIENMQRRNYTANRVVNKAINNYMVAGIIHLALPHAKMIHIERHPLDSCVSTYSKIFAQAAQSYSYDLKELGKTYAQHKEIMTYWMSQFPDQILHVRYEDMVEDLEREARRIIDFINLEWDDKCLKFYEADKTVKTASKGQVFQPIFTSSLNKWKRYEKYLAPLVEGLGDWAPEDCRYIVEKYG